MIYTKVDSSMLDLVAYDPKTQVLEVRFINSGDIYQYFDVPKKVYKGLLTASSKGTYMHDYILEVYPYSRINRPNRRSRQE